MPSGDILHFDYRFAKNDRSPRIVVLEETQRTISGINLNYLKEELAAAIEADPPSTWENTPSAAKAAYRVYLRAGIRQKTTQAAPKKAKATGTKESTDQLMARIAEAEGSA